MPKMLPLLTPTDFVALANQTLEFAYPSVEIEGEVLNFKISRGRWVYFDIADEFSKIRCFGTVYILPTPIEDGMKIRLVAAPRLHPQFGFSLSLTSLQLSGEGTIKKASDLLQLKLEKEGLFAIERKRPLPYPPEHIGLITSEESAGYRDFIKVLGARYGGLQVELANVQVQGEPAVQQIVNAVDWFNKQADTPDALVLLRGGGSADDLQAFSSEQVTRAVAASRIPTMVAIGHETDVSLAELAADARASTPSNAAELLVPDKREIITRLDDKLDGLDRRIEVILSGRNQQIIEQTDLLFDLAEQVLSTAGLSVEGQLKTLEALSPQAVLRRGYAVITKNGRAAMSAKDLAPGDKLKLKLADGEVRAEVQ